MEAPGHGGRRQVAFDAALAAGALALSASIGLTGPVALRGPGPWLLVVAHVLPVAFRRRAPRAAFAVSVAAGALFVALGWPTVVLGLAVLVMTYSVAVALPFREALVALVAAEVAMVASIAVGADLQPDTVVGNVMVVAAAWVLGDLARRRRELAAAEQARLARRAVGEERLRIARELHDIVAHSMSVVAVQAGSARMVAGDDPDRARRALASIEQVSREALDELRRLVGVLRTEGPDEAARTPMPGLDDVTRLVSSAVEAGTPVEVRVDGERPSLPPGLELAAFRVLQEALTNVRRHAPGSPARVRLRYGGDELVIAVENDLRRGGAAAGGGSGSSGGGGAGQGLAGMRERVALYGGTVVAGAGDGRFHVEAHLPYAESAR
ncbi:MAG TPA: histidine kinase [Acidimicrobiales bacterium]|nr:histidine kinase [Acidimicrobiales bacterium]